MLAKLKGLMRARLRPLEMSEKEKGPGDGGDSAQQKKGFYGRKHAVESVSTCVWGTTSCR